MYVHTPFPNIVYALDLKKDGENLSKYEPKQDPNTIPVRCCDTVSRGVAYADGKVFLHQADTTGVALDAKTGKVVWSVVNGDPKKGETNTATVLPVKDKVIVGVSGGEFGVRGSVTALMSFVKLRSHDLSSPRQHGAGTFYSGSCIGGSEAVRRR
jgi:glucose dehydrogenase